VLKQLENIGPAGVLKLVNIGVKSIEALEHTEPYRIETALKRNQPFGMQVIEAAKAFPKLRVSLSVVGKPVSATLPLSRHSINVLQSYKAGQGARINVDAEIGFLNDKPVVRLQNQQVYLVFMAETSDGRSVHFARSRFVVIFTPLQMGMLTVKVLKKSARARD
jgi:ATP-dependent DNA helicase HFM1/MER3